MIKIDQIDLTSFKYGIFTSFRNIYIHIIFLDSKGIYDKNDKSYIMTKVTFCYKRCNSVETTLISVYIPSNLSLKQLFVAENVNLSFCIFPI